MTELIMVRHGETRANLDGKYCGRLDPPLSETGINSVNKTARTLAAFRPARIYSSEALRARQTAAIIEPNGTVVCLQALREMNFGEFEGLNANEIQSRMPDIWKRYIDNYRNFTFPGGDNVNDYLTKSAETINAIITESIDGGVLIVSHKGFILSALSSLLHGDSHHIFSYDISPAGFARLSLAGGFPVLKQLV